MKNRNSSGLLAPAAARWFAGGDRLGSQACHHQQTLELLQAVKGAPE